jgi:hypothetical protein
MRFSPVLSFVSIRVHSRRGNSALRASAGGMIARAEATTLPAKILVAAADQGFHFAISD